MSDHSRTLTGLFDANGLLILDVKDEVTEVLLSLDFVKPVLDLFADFHSGCLSRVQRRVLNDVIWRKNWQIEKNQRILVRSSHVTL